MKDFALWKTLLDVLYPSCCLTCQTALLAQEEAICLKCFAELTPTDYHTYKDNPIARKFHGKVPIEWAFACFPFVRKGKIQQILHALKYDNQKNLSYILGKWYGRYLRAEGFAPRYDWVAPIPLHSAKLKKRGYNQSDGFAEGLAQAFETSWASNLLIRTKNTTTQTRKTREMRWENVQDIFSVNPAYTVKGCRILVVDDVVTTGATLESALLTLRQAGCTTTDLAAIAYA